MAVKKYNELQNKEFRNYDSYDPNKINKQPSKKSLNAGEIRRKVEKILEQKAFNDEYSI